MGDPKQHKFKSVIEGPRWAGLSTFMKNSAHMAGVELDLDIDKGWFTETIRFTVQGTKEKVLSFLKAMDRSVEAYNSDEEEEE